MQGFFLQTTALTAGRRYVAGTHSTGGTEIHGFTGRIYVQVQPFRRFWQDDCGHISQKPEELLAIFSPMHSMDLSLPQIIDLTTHQRRRAEKALAVAHRHLTAQEQKVKRLRDFMEQLPELVADQASAGDTQLVKHQEAAQKEYDEAVDTMQKLRTMRKKLQHKVQNKIEVERKMETLSVSNPRERASDERVAQMAGHDEPVNVFPMDASSSNPH